MALALDDLGRAGDSRPQFERAIQIQSELVRLNPSDPSLALRLVQMGQGFAALHERQGRVQEAEAQWHEIGQSLEQIVALHPDVVDFSANLADSRYAEGEFFTRQGDLQQANRAFEAAFRVQEQLAASAPENGDARNLLASWLRTCPDEKLRDLDRADELEQGLAPIVALPP